MKRFCLQPGSRVLDVGCGTGSSFPFLVQAVGADGEVVGVEISPDLAAIARKRIEQEEWNNVRVAVGPAQTIALPGKFDGLLLSWCTRCLPRPKPWITCSPISKTEAGLWHSAPNSRTPDEANY